MSEVPVGPISLLSSSINWNFFYLILYLSLKAHWLMSSTVSKTLFPRSMSVIIKINSSFFVNISSSALSKFYFYALKKWSKFWYYLSDFINFLKSFNSVLNNFYITLSIAFLSEIFLTFVPILIWVPLLSLQTGSTSSVKSLRCFSAYKACSEMNVMILLSFC